MDEQSIRQNRACLTKPNSIVSHKGWHPNFGQKMYAVQKESNQVIIRKLRTVENCKIRAINTTFDQKLIGYMLKPEGQLRPLKDFFRFRSNERIFTAVVFF